MKRIRVDLAAIRVHLAELARLFAEQRLADTRRDRRIAELLARVAP